MLRFHDERSRPGTVPMTTDRHDTDPAPELSDEFWGEQTEWTQRRRPVERGGIGATIGRWWDHLLGGDADGGRAHGRSATPSSPDVRRHDNDVHDDGDDGDNSGWTIEPEPLPERRGGVDPLIARLGGLAVIVTLAAPLIVGFTASGDESSSDDAPARCHCRRAGRRVGCASDDRCRRRCVGRCTDRPGHLSRTVVGRH